MNEERRKFKRFIVVNLKLLSQDTEEHIGQVINFSEGGLLAVADDSMERNSLHKFRIPFNQIIYDKIHFDFEGRIIWSKTNSIDPSKYSIGVEFSSITEPQKEFIEKLIKAFSD